MPGHRSNVNKTTTSQTGGPAGGRLTGSRGYDWFGLRVGVPTTSHAAVSPPVVLSPPPIARSGSRTSWELANTARGSQATDLGW